MSDCLTDEGGYTGSFDQFFQDWISNKIIFGSWVKHLREWLAAAEEPGSRVLVVKYEDMKSDLAGTVRRVAEFLGCPVAVSIDSRIVPKVLSLALVFITSQSVAWLLINLDLLVSDVKILI
jgi:hypothetical protein